MNLLIDGELVLDGTVGDMGLFGGQAFTATDVANALAKKGRSSPIKVRINSGGGLAAEGVAIFNRLRAHQGKVTVIVDGVAASAASVIAMAGREIVMARGAVMMIHDPSGLTMGTSADHSKTVESLETIAESMAAIYAERTGRTLAAIREEMRSELWMSADEAVAAGFADRVEKLVRTDSKIAAFDYGLYMRAPERLVAVAQANAWKLDSGAFKERERAENISAACAIAKSGRAAEFIAKGLSVGEVCAILRREKESEATVHLHTRPPPAASNSSWDKVMAEYNARFDAGLK
jgi:ATP-dependent Clp protease, protease subunit